MERERKSLSEEENLGEISLGLDGQLSGQKWEIRMFPVSRGNEEGDIGGDENDDNNDDQEERKSKKFPQK